MLFNLFWYAYALDVLKKYLKKIIIFGDNQYIKLELEEPSKLNVLLLLLKNHSKLKFNLLNDIACIDFINIKKKRFSLNYLLLSCAFGCRLNVYFYLKENEPVQSSSNIFSGSNWLEREVWDLFGVFFFKHPDLRRILTDYGFSGYPFRKDFPLNGYLEIRYDDNKQYLVYEPIELSQGFRFYDFLNPFKKQINSYY